MKNEGLAPKVLPPSIDTETAERRFQSFMTSGLWRPGGLRTSGEWHEPKLLLIPAQSVTAQVSSNWTAESGTKSGKKVIWTPLSGQHQETHRDIRFLSSKAWSRQERRLLATMGTAEWVDGLPTGAEVADSDLSEAEIQQKAEVAILKAEERACAKMIPGRLKRQLQVNSTIESLEVQTVLLPVYEVGVDHLGRTHTGWVHGITGAVYATKPTSYGRIAAVVGGLAALAAMLIIGFFATIIAAGQAEQAERERLAAEEIQALETEWASSREELTAAVASAEAALEDRKPGEARAALGDAPEVMPQLHERLEDPDLEELWTRYQAVGVDIEHIGAIVRGLEVTKAVVADADRCTMRIDILNAWGDLRLVRPEDPEWKQASSAARSLERCRVRLERELSATLKKLRIDKRAALPPKMERSLLDDGFDVRVKAQGRNKDSLRMTWVLFGRASVHQIANKGSMAAGSFLRNLQDAGFRKVTFSDGYDESFTYDLEPEPEDNLGQKELQTLGLGEPLELVTSP